MMKKALAGSPCLKRYASASTLEEEVAFKDLHNSYLVDLIEACSV
jgi:hypothetical protein